jgi:hypothetical protein
MALRPRDRRLEKSVLTAGRNGMKRSSIGVLAGIVLPAMALAAAGQASKKPVKIEDPKDLPVVINTDKPQGSPVSLEFKEDLVLTGDDWTPSNVQVDGSGNIYVFTGADRKVRKFDPKGVEIAGWPLKKGQGPGEFQMIDAHIFPDGTCAVYDAPLRRLTTLNAKGEVQSIRKMDFWGMVATMDSRRNIYDLDVRFLAGTRDRQRLVLAKHAPSGELIAEMRDYLWGLTYLPAKRKYLTKLFPPQMKYAVDESDVVYFALSDAYEIRVLSPEGTLVRKIVKKTPARKATQRDIDKKLSLYSESSRTSFYDFDISDSMPSIAALFPLENAGLLVVTFESPPEAKYLLGDIFDGDGAFRGRVQIPLYAGWDGLMAPASPWALCRGDCFYAIVADETEETHFVKRYKMIWK